jgi:hypothetical protein
MVMANMRAKNFADVIRRQMVKDPALAAAVERALAEEVAALRELVAQPLPCPCCGGRVDFGGGDPWEDWARDCGFCVQCPPCNLSLWSFKGESPDAVVARWNRRAAHSA